MSTIQRIVYVNPIEPGPISMRIPADIELRLAVSFLDQGGAPINVDLLAQLELTARSNGGPAICYPMPATDVINGKARATFPVGSITDPNGYRMTLYGSMGGEIVVLATGVADVFAAATPQSVIDVIDSIDLTLERGEDALLEVNVWTDADGTSPYDLGSTGVAATIYDRQGGTVLASFVVTMLDANTAELTMASEVVNILPDQCWWTLTSSTSAGLTTLAEGNVAVTGTVAPPFVNTTYSYDYQKPAALTVPAGGQILHSTGALDLLRIDEAGHTAFFDLLIVGDTIQIGATTWSIQDIHKVATYREVTILPATQAAVSGSQSVLFARPAP